MNALHFVVREKTIMKIRIGQGYDVHQLVEGRPFVLRGIQIEHTHGPSGHSDGDALIHAICDALLGAADLRDIGFHFSDKIRSTKTGTVSFSFKR